MFSLSKKVAIVTGGSGDLGFAISEAYSKAGAQVVLVGRDAEKLTAAIQRLSHPESAFAVVADVADDSQVDSMVEKVLQKYEHIDILVTAAGVQHRSPTISFDHAKWDQVLKVNLTGTFYCAQAVAKHMIKRQTGRIIMITSLTAEFGIPNIAAYAASRGGIRQLSKTLAVELAPEGVTVNCIGPGRFQTSMTSDVFQDEVKRQKFLSVIPMGRTGSPDDLAGIAVFLASDASSYITGQSIYVDGGWLAACGNILG
jgi:NAD(P)-dependent dehydrogenase (short-subunit alcohol dehydrogenase family)